MRLSRVFRIFTLPIMRLVRAQVLFALLRVSIAVSVFVLVTVLTAFVLLKFPALSQVTFDERLESPPPLFDAVVLETPPFSELIEFGGRPVPLATPRAFPFRP